MVCRKDIDGKPPYPYIALRCGYRVGAYFRYSSLNESFIFNKDTKNISIFNPWTRKIELVIRNRVGNVIIDFQLFGEKKNRVVAVTGDGCLILYSVDYEKKRGKVAHRKVKLKAEGNEWSTAISICQKDKYGLMSTSKSLYTLSRISYSR